MSVSHPENGAALGPAELAELHWLRSENELLRTERDALVRLATGFAKDVGLLRGKEEDR
ncbi:hypothetical protein [Sciscionella sediminilitoris]|uniref:hypothetical protein n=1 Tax=Sciscionella sediminilitoris TaxID=1445613 RepID=UPI0018D14006|nr:hypothetical protein [Sciscionella sp. SE31]